MAFESHAPNLANLQSYLNEENNKKRDFGDGPTWWSIPKGMSSIRILPPWDPSGRIALAVNMHPIEYQNSSMKYKKYNWTCVNKTFGKPCKICEGLQAMSAAGVDVSKYEANRRQFYMNAIVMHDPRYHASISAGKKPEDAEGVAPGTHVILKSPKTLYDWVIAQITNPMVGDITSITNGIDIYVTKEGDGLGTKYTPTLSPNGRTAIPQEYLNAIESLHNLDEIFSTGFQDDLIDEMVSNIKKSAGVMTTDVPNVVNQMAGYTNIPPVVTPSPVQQSPYGQQAPVNPYQVTPPVNNQVSPMNSVAPNPYMNNTGAPAQNPYMSVPPVPNIAPSPFTNPVQGTQTEEIFTPRNSAVNTTPNVSAGSPTEMNLPKCFGNYNPQQVNCVVCPAEITCSQKSASSTVLIHG